MYDKGKIMTGIIIGVFLLTFPLWYNLALGKAKKPDPKIDTPVIQKLPEKERKCVETKEYMRANHMALLNDWRNSVVREASRVYVGLDEKEYDISLQNTCINCHSNKSKFCDECHNYAAVTPYCWTCHIEPKKEKET